MDIDPIKVDILYKLWRNRCFGKGHMLIDNVLRGFPRNKINEFRDALDELIKDGILIIKKTGHGDAVFIDPRKRVLIRDLLKEYYDFL